MKTRTTPRATRHTTPSAAERLHAILRDGRWHGTQELCRRIGCSFGLAKHRLLRRHKGALVIERRAHPKMRYQYEYRLLRERRA